MKVLVDKIIEFKNWDKARQIIKYKEGIDYLWNKIYKVVIVLNWDVIWGEMIFPAHSWDKIKKDLLNL